MSLFDARWKANGPRLLHELKAQGYYTWADIVTEAVEELTSLRAKLAEKDRTLVAGMAAQMISGALAASATMPAGASRDTAVAAAVDVARTILAKVDAT